MQVVDRFHLLVNVREALTRVVDRHHTHVSEAAKAVATRRESQDSTAPIEAAGSAAPPRLRRNYRARPSQVFSGEPAAWNATSASSNSISRGFR